MLNLKSTARASLIIILILQVLTQLYLHFFQSTAQDFQPYHSVVSNSRG